ncbi:MAG: DUF4440 domain-containing protein [Bacteroidia bacterium]
MLYKNIFLIGLLMVIMVHESFSQALPNKDEAAIHAVLANQEAAWNRGDLDAFMEGYWKSDSLSFVGSRGLTRGWATTLANYKKSYPDKSTMGTLVFKVLHLRKLSGKTAYMVGSWTLLRPEKGDIGGHFSLVWKKVKGKWVIVADHSS